MDLLTERSAEMREWFENKNVAVVGNAESLLSKTHGSWIDSHDAVVRINRSAALFFPHVYGADAVGRKTDVWISRTLRPSFLSELKAPIPPHLMSVYENSEQKSHHIWGCRSDYLKIKSSLRIKAPSMGFFTLYWIKQFDPKSVSVLGFDFKLTPTFYDQKKKLRDQESANHDYAKEQQIFEDVLVKQHHYQWIE